MNITWMPFCEPLVFVAACGPFASQISQFGNVYVTFKLIESLSNVIYLCIFALPFEYFSIYTHLLHIPITIIALAWS